MVDVALDGGGVHLVEVAAAGTRRVVAASAEPMLWYELRDGAGRALASGGVADPRQLRAEWVEGDEMRGQDVVAPGATLTIRLPAVAGELVVFENTPSGLRELGPDRLDARAPGRRQSAVTDPAGDVLGPPVPVMYSGDPARSGTGRWRPEHDCLMRGGRDQMCAVCRREMDRVLAGLEDSPLCDRAVFDQVMRVDDPATTVSAGSASVRIVPTSTTARISVEPPGA